MVRPKFVRFHKERYSRTGHRMNPSKVVPCFMIALLLAASSAAQLRQVAIIDIPGQPGFDALALAGKYVVISHTAANAVDVFDPALRRVVAQIKGLSGPRGLAVDLTAGRVYVANSGSNSIAVLSTQDWKVHDTIQLSTSPDSLLLVPEWQALCVGDWRQHAVSLISLEQPSQVSTTPIGGVPQRLVFDPQQNLVFASTQGTSELVALDQKSAIAHRYRLNASQPTGLAFDSKDDRLYVAVRSAVLVVDPQDGSVVAKIVSPQSVNELWYDQKTRSIYAAAEDGSVTMIKADGGHYLNQNQLHTQVKGHTLAFDPSREYVYMPGGREGRSKLVILKRVESPAMAAAAAEPSTPQQQVAQKH